jgi:probable addiction module antidote protein
MPKRTANYREGLLESLTDPQEASDYLQAALSDSNEAFLVALRDVAEARQMTRVAKDAGVAREALYRMLSESGNPTLTNFSAILRSVGLKFEVIPLDAEPSGGTPPLMPRQTEIEPAGNRGQNNQALADLRIQFATANANTPDVTLLRANGYNPTFAPVNVSSGSTNQIPHPNLPTTPSANSYSSPWWRNAVSQPGLQDTP